jgi:FkbM family methyltransferase
MKKIFNQATKGFLYRAIENLARKNLFVYYWTRRLLPLYVYFTGSPHERFFEILKKIPERPGVILDVGANDGVSVFSIRTLNKTNPILSLEPNPEQKQQLQILTKFFKNYQFQIIAAGEKQDKLTLYSPIYKGYPLTSFATLKPELLDLPGYGMFTQNYDSSKLSFVKRTVKVIPIDELNLDLTFVKIDVEGTELSVLKGMISTIRRCKPVIMIERVSFTISEIKKMLHEFDYRLVDPETANFVSDKVIDDEPNLIFWPAELIPKN